MMKKRRKTGWSVRRCMYHDATRKNFTAAITSSSVMMSPFGMLPSRYETPISTPVMTTSTTATTTYCSGSGCALISPGSSPGACRCADSGMRSSRSSRSVSVDPAVVATVPSVLMTNRSVGDQVDDGEDHDPDDVDEVPVQAGDLHPFGVALSHALLHRETPQRHQPDDAAGDVGAVQAREHEEARAEQAGVDVEALAREL